MRISQRRITTVDSGKLVCRTDIAIKLVARCLPGTPGLIQSPADHLFRRFQAGFSQLCTTELGRKSGAQVSWERNGGGRGRACGEASERSFYQTVSHTSPFDVVVRRCPCKERWISHAGTVEAGRINPTKAKAMWDEWAANGQHVRDHLGPDGSLQLYVRTDIEILEDDVYTKGKSLNRGQKQMKDPSTLELAKKRRELFTGLEDVGEA